MYLDKNRTLKGTRVAVRRKRLSGMGDCPSGYLDTGDGGCVKKINYIPIPGLPVPPALQTDAQGKPTNYQPPPAFTIVNLDPAQQPQNASSSQPQTSSFFNQELIAGTGIKTWHAMAAGGLLIGIAAVKGRKG
ncbi:MAG TPA: hypothetical protein VH024_00235 [Candidatus Angelobacter sp.]|jgi:hypothetical protein|nr:hypothetical protein [Candidatus Angelobacter sp.]